MERHVGIPTTLFGGPPELGNMTKLANSQIGFINMFAAPLFEAVADILPDMQFAVDEIKLTLSVWQLKIEQSKMQESPREREREKTEGFQSPRSGSPTRTTFHTPVTSAPETSPTLPLASAQGIANVPSGIDQTLRHANGGQPAQSPEVLEASQRLSPSFPLANITNTDVQLGAMASPETFRVPSAGASSRSISSATQSQFNEGIFRKRSASPMKNPSPPKRSDFGGDGAADISTGSGVDNFSRPLSFRPSGQVSPPSRNAAAVSSNAHLHQVPSSPSDVKGTSFFSGSSDGTADVPEQSRPGSGNSSAVTGSAASHDAAIGQYSDQRAEPQNSASPNMVNGHSVGDGRTVRKKNSKWSMSWLRGKKVRETSE